MNFVIKLKIFIYLSKSISSSSKLSPPDIMHLCQRFFQSLKHLLNSISEIAFKAFFDSACISSIVSKRFPRSGLLSLGNSQKSHGAKSGEYGACGTICETHYHDAKTTSCLPKIYFETVLSDSLEMPIVSTRSLIVNRRFLYNNFLI